MVKKRIKVSNGSKARPMRRTVDYEDVYEDLRQGFRPCDIARKHQISDRMVRYIRAKQKALESSNV